MEQGSSLFRGISVKNIFFWAASFLLPILLFVLMLEVSEIYPFGSESLLTEDLKYQYIDFFAWFRSVLRGEASIFYAPNLSLGTNTWGLFGYYLSSPLNLLVVFFDEAHLTDFVVLITGLKIGLINLSMSFYLNKKFALNKLFITMLAVCYTCSLWTVTQIRNPMWLDALIFLPLVLYGVHCLITEDKWKLLLFAATFSVITCWYTAYMLILFSLFFFAYELFLYRQDHTLNKKDLFAKVFKFGGIVGVALLVSAFTFLPTILSMAGGGSPDVFRTLTLSGVRDLYSSLFLGNWVHNIIPQNFFGTFVLLLVGIFFCTRTISIKQKVVTVIFLGFMIASSWLAPLYVMWSGFRVPHGFYCRLTFLTTFLFIFVAAAALERIQKKDISQKEIVFGGALLGALIVLCIIIQGFLQSEQAFFMLAVTVFATLVLFVFRSEKVKKAVMKPILLGLLLVVACVELVYSGCLALPQLYQGYLQSDHDAYLKESDVQLAELRDFDNSLYRIDKTYTRAEAAALNEGLAVGYLQLSSYSSATNKTAVDFLNSLGYGHEGEILVRYASPILTSDSLLGLKYVSSDSTPAGLSDVGLSEVSGGARFYQNPYALSLGYLVDEAVLDCSLDSYANPFERQNAFLSSLLGVERDFFIPAEAVIQVDSAGLKEWTINVPEGFVGYTYADIEGIDPVLLTIDDREPVLENWWLGHCVRELGFAEKNATHTVSFVPTILGDNSPEPWKLGSNDTCLFYYLDVTSFEEAIEKLSADQFEFDVLEGNYASGSFSAEEDSLLLLTIPHEKGWSVEVNGEKVEALDAFGGALTVLPLTSGENEIVMTYVSPGFVPGCFISITTLLVVGALTFREYRLGVLRRPKNEQSTLDNAISKPRES